MLRCVNNKTKIAVVGAGIFGVTAALELSKENSVDLYEIKDDILRAASGINQLRLHRGYHYPRSEKNAVLLSKEFEVFNNHFSKCIILNDNYYYCIAKDNSKTSASQYLEFCKKHKLEYEEKDLDFISKEKISLSVKVREGLLDLFKLKLELRKGILKSKINLLLNTKFQQSFIQKYDYVVICTYAALNKFLENYPHNKREYKFQVCEKPVVKLPKSFKNTSIVVFDGPFLTLDPYGRTGLHLMTHVKHAIHSENIGIYPEFDEKLLSVIDKGIVKKPPFSNFKFFRESVREFVPGIRNIEYIGSMFTIKTVLPYVEKTDERPTLIEQVNSNLISVLGGKIVTCVSTANKISKLINREKIKNDIWKESYIKVS